MWTAARIQAEVWGSAASTHRPLGTALPSRLWSCVLVRWEAATTVNYVAVSQLSNHIGFAGRAGRHPQHWRACEYRERHKCRAQVQERSQHPAAGTTLAALCSAALPQRMLSVVALSHRVGPENPVICPCRRAVWPPAVAARCARCLLPLMHLKLPTAACKPHSSCHSAFTYQHTATGNQQPAAQLQDSRRKISLPRAPPPAQLPSRPFPSTMSASCRAAARQVSRGRPWNAAIALKLKGLGGGLGTAL